LRPPSSGGRRRARCRRCSARVRPRPGIEQGGRAPCLMPHHTIRRRLSPSGGFCEALRASGPVDGVGERGKFGNATRVGTRQPVYGAPVRAAWVILLCALGCATTGQGPPASPPDRKSV